jgi:hypothetical protein
MRKKALKKNKKLNNQRSKEKLPSFTHSENKKKEEKNDDILRFGPGLTGR